jgi:hypothetical protein
MRVGLLQEKKDLGRMIFYLKPILVLVEGVG